MARPDDMLTTQAVAEALRVTPPRVRQMVDEGKLAPPVEFGPRIHLWHHADVLVAKLTMDAERVSRTSTVMPTMEAPLPRRHDQVIAFPLHHKPGQAHVRIWAGPAPEGPRTVVLIGSLHSNLPGIVNYIERIAEIVDNRFLGGRGHDAIWFDYHPHAMMGQHDEHRVTNLILRYTEDPPISDPPLPAGHHRVEPAWRPTTIAEVERVVGEAVECYPTPAYTPITIERWQSARHTVDVEHDTVDLTAAAAALRAMTQVRTGHPRAELAATTRTILATMIRERLDRIDVLVTGRPGRKPSWRNGLTPTRPNAIGAPPSSPTWPTTFAARLVPPRLAPADEQELARYPDDYPWPSTPKEAARVKPAVEQLRHWSADTGQFGDEHDDTLHQAIDLARKRLVQAVRWVDPDFDDQPTYNALKLKIMGDTDRRYLEQIAWDKSPVKTRHHRELEALFLAEHRDHLRFGFDPWHRLVATTKPELGEPETFAVQWPTRPNPDRSSDDTTLLADGGIDGGDRPVYLQTPEGPLNLLPRDPAHVHIGWNFGYGGGGPSALTNAIGRYISLVDNTIHERLPYAWIDDQVTNSRREHLQINLGDLRRRIPTTPGNPAATSR